jgi:hypothetical protein
LLSLPTGGGGAEGPSARGTIGPWAPWGTVRRCPSMFISHSVHIDRPAGELGRELRQWPPRWLPDTIGGPTGGRSFEARVGFDAAGARIGKKVELTVGEPSEEGDWVTIPLAWQATGPSGLFPVLDARLRVEPIGVGASRLSLAGNYQPPLGSLGREIDGTVLHGVAEATLRDFLEGVAGRLSRPATTGTS